MRGNERFDVFLSYARGDGLAAAELNTWLRSQGFRTFFDQSELHPGLRWISALEDAIGDSDAVAILVGRHGIGNTQQYERELALVRQTQDDKFPVIPVLMPGCENPPTGFLKLLTWIDLSNAVSVLQQPDSLALFRAALRGEAIAVPSIRAKVCPYRGLEPFREEDAPFFCGRDDAIRELVAKVQAHVFVAVVGASGSGKSSLVFAGLLPALRKESQTRTWDVVSLRPGKSPLAALAAAFGTAPENAGPAEIDAYLEREAEFYRAGDVRTLARIVDRRLDAAPEKPDRLLIYVDQWEELYYATSPAADDKEHLQQHTSDVDKFIGLLVGATSGARSRATVVFTVRADFYNPLVQSPLISALLPHQQINIPLMGADDLRSAIETPAKNAGLSFSPPELVDEILNDVGSQEGRLPLLQFALKETWERREEDRLTAEAYTAVGGVTGAIEKTAESVYNSLTPAQQDAARRLFLRLITPGEGQEDTRARSLIPDDPQQRDVINLFSDPKTRLLVTGFSPLQGSGPVGGDIRPTVEVAHEALIQRWPTLKAWVNVNREKLRARTAILRAMAEWNENGRVDSFLLDRGVHLERGRSLVKDTGDVPVDDIHDYVDRSIERDEERLDAEREAALADQKRIAEAERKAKEAAENAAQLSEAKRAAAEVARRKLRNRAVMAAFAAVIALLGFGVSFYERQLASENARRAEDNARTAEENERTAKAEARETQRQLDRADRAAQQTQHQLDRANQALAAGILADLDLKPEKPLTARQRNALWELATADEAVRAQFISDLSASGKEIARIAAGFREVSRALGLQSRALGLEWPLPGDAEKLLATAVVAVDPENSGTMGDVLQAVAAKLTEAQAQQALAPLLEQMGKTTDPDALKALARALQAVPAKLTEAQAQQALAPLLEQIGKTGPFALNALGGALQAVAAKLTEAQAQQALAPLLQQFGKTTDPSELKALAEALQALPAKLTEAQVQQALAPLLKQMGKTTDPFALKVLAGALQVVPAKLTEAQAQQALAPLLQQIGKTTDPEALDGLGLLLRAVAAKLTEAQAQQALAPLLEQMGKTTDPEALWALAGALRALRVVPAKLTEAQAQQALAPLLEQMGKTTYPLALEALAGTLQVVAAKLTEAQAQQALTPLLQQIGKTTERFALEALAGALQAVAAKLTEAQVQQALAPLLTQIGKTTNPHALKALAGALQAVVAKLTKAQVQQALALLLQQFGKTTDPYELKALAEALQAPRAKLTEAQAQQALAPLLQQFGKTTNPYELKALAEALQALPAKLTEAQVQQALAPLLKQMGKTTEAFALEQLAGALRVVPAKLTEAQAQQALAPLLQQIGKTTERYAFKALAGALQAVAAKLTEAQAQQALTIATSSLAWAATEDEAIDWARAVVALLSSATDQDETGKLVSAIAYPPAAGPATEVLLDALRARHSDAPAKEAGTAPSMAWIAEKYPNEVRPICPPPPQPIALSGLKCPQGDLSPSNAPKDVKDSTAR